MAVGDNVLDGYSSIANGSFLTIQPGSNIEWLIMAVYGESGATYELWASDGANDKLIDSFSGGSVHNLNWRITNGFYLKLKNTARSAKYLGFKGVITK